MAKFSKKLILTYDLRDETISMDAYGGVSTEDGISMLMTGLEVLVKNHIATVPQKYKQRATEEAHDRLNIMFMRFLEQIIPASEIPDLTTEAIMKAENDLIKEATKRKMTIEDLLTEKRDKRMNPKPRAKRSS
jgi:hypothetical protein